MNNRNYLFFTFLIITFTKVIAQNPLEKKIETKFFRPALTNMYVKPSNQDAQTVISTLMKIPVEKRFDDHSIKSNILIIKNSKNSKQEISNQLIKTYSKSIVAKWWCRDNLGNMSDTLIRFRGANTATDADILTNNNGNNTRLSNLGFDLLKKTYVIVFDITSVKSMTEIYNEIDAKRKATAVRLNSVFTPVERTREGYEVDYEASVYKLDWNDSIHDNFFNNYYLDTTYKEDRTSRINAFNNSSFPIQFMESVTGTISSTQPNNPDSYKFGKVRKSMIQLLQESAFKVHEEAIFKVSKKVEDFRVKVKLISVYPTLAKIGTKEGIYLNQRFFVYYLDNVKNKKKKKAVVRVRTIALNDTIANGESPTSRFRQVGGRKIKPHYFLEAKEDRGYSFTLAYAFNDTTVSSGYHLAFDARLDRLYKIYNTNSSSRLIRNLHASLNLTANPFTGVKFEGDTKDSATTGMSFNLGVNLGREVFITKKGNLYLFPEIGGSILGYSFSKIHGTTLESKSPLSMFVNYGLNASLGLGLNVTSSMSIIIKPSYNIRLSEFVSTNKSKDGVDLKLANSYNFRNINNSSFPIFVGLRFRL